MTTESDEWVEGSRGKATQTYGDPFACCLFLPLGTEEESPRRRREVRTPRLLLEAGVELQKEDLVVIVAPELGYPAVQDGDPEETRWQVEGTAQPFGPPGEDLVGKQINVKVVNE